MADYHINVFWSDEDSCYIADIPDLEFCSAHGDTPEEALREVLVAKEGWLAVAEQRGIPILSLATDRPKHIVLLASSPSQSR